MFFYSLHFSTNKSTSKFVISTIGISSFCISFVKSIFVCETFSISFFFSCFWSCFFSALLLFKPGFYFLIILCYYSNKFVMINIETLEIKSLIVCNLVFVNDGIFSWFFCFFLINDFYDFNFCKHCKKNFPTAELVIPTGIPTNKAKAEIKM